MHNSEAELGRAAAERLAEEWPDVAWVPTAPTREWAEAALERFTEIIRAQPLSFVTASGGRGEARGVSVRAPSRDSSKRCKTPTTSVRQSFVSRFGPGRVTRNC